MANIVTEAQANTYFATRFGAAAYWVDDASDNIKALTFANNQLAALYDLDTTNEEHRNAVCEQALFLLRNPGGADRRDDLVAWGVTQAGHVGEQYSPSRDGMGICSYARRVLADVLLSKAAKGGLQFGRLTRDDTA